MQCPRCQLDNPAGQKFCGECGARLASACPSCGASNPPAQKFCGECGTRLGQTDGTTNYGTPESYTPKHLAEKILTSKAALEGGPRTTQGRRTMIAAAKELNVQIGEVVVETPAGLEDAIRKAKDQGAQALYIWPSGLTFSFGRQLSDLALANRLPSIHPFRESAEAGGLLSYAPSLTDIGRRGAVYVDKILRGAKPGELPVEQPTKFELIINLKTAKALGLTIPPSLLQRADQIIE